MSQPSWVPQPDETDKSLVARQTCDMLAWHLAGAGASQELLDKVQELSKAIRHEMGPVFDHGECKPATWSHRTHNHEGQAGAWLFPSEAVAAG